MKIYLYSAITTNISTCIATSEIHLTLYSLFIINPIIYITYSGRDEAETCPSSVMVRTDSGPSQNRVRTESAPSHVGLGPVLNRSMSYACRVGALNREGPGSERPWTVLRQGKAKVPMEQPPSTRLSQANNSYLKRIRAFHTITVRRKWGIKKPRHDEREQGT